LINKLNKYYSCTRISFIKSSIIVYLIIWTINCTFISLLPGFEYRISNRADTGEEVYNTFTGTSHNVLPAKEETANIKINIRLKNISVFNLSDVIDNKTKMYSYSELVDSESLLIQTRIINESVTPRSPPDIHS
jgi:hypothetical protein